MFSRVPAIRCCTVVTLYRRQQRIWIMLLYFITSGLPHAVEKYGVFGWWYDRTEVGVSACDIHNHLFKAKTNNAPKILRSKFSFSEKPQTYWKTVMKLILWLTNCRIDTLLVTTSFKGAPEYLVYQAKQEQIYWHRL